MPAAAAAKANKPADKNKENQKGYQLTLERRMKTTERKRKKKEIVPSDGAHESGCEEIGKAGVQRKDVRE